MTEAQFSTLFGKWAQDNRNLLPDGTLAIEYKITKGGTFNIKRWIEKQPHQLVALRDSTTNKGVYHKISDQSQGVKPFDSFFISNIPEENAILSIYFVKHKEFFNIPFTVLKDYVSNVSLSYKDLKNVLDSYRFSKTKKPPSVVEF